MRDARSTPTVRPAWITRRTKKAIGLGAGSLLLIGLAFTGGYLVAETAGDARAEVLKAKLANAHSETRKTTEQLRSAEEHSDYLTDLIARMNDQAADAANRAASQSRAVASKTEEEHDSDDDSDDDATTWRDYYPQDGPAGVEGSCPVGIGCSEWPPKDHPEWGPAFPID